jgi:long-chain acyl-CoA synthetase
MVEVITSAEADAAQARVAGALQASGYAPGDRIALCLPTSAALLHAIGGALRSGVVPVVVNHALLPVERAVIRTDADAREWVDDAARLEELGAGPGAELAPFPLARPMHYTSGTTGRPKGVWSGVLSEADAERVVGEEVEQWQFEAADVHLVCSPLQHSAPIRFALNSLLAGGSVVLPGPFSVDGAVDAVATHGVTTAFCTPAHLQRLDDAGCLAALASLRLVAHAGAPCPESLKRRAIDAVGVTRLWEFYGSTEGQFTVCASGDWLERPGTVGRARTGRSLEVDGDGAVWCHTPVWARWEYWRDPERTAAAWRRDAFTVGDLGRLDDDGFLFLSGRRSDLIITGGVNVYPAEVEQALGELPGVDDVVVFGRPDERWGQRVCAAVVGTVTVDQVLSFAAGRLAPYKRPKEVHLVAEIPRVGLAKVRRHVLAAELGLE